jgi:hypothetical protein
MFVVKDERDYLLAFLTGYEIGKESTLSNELSKLLEKKYGCPKRAMGWNGQIEMYAKKIGLSWESTLKKVLLEVVIKKMKEGEKAKIEEFIKSKVVANISQIQPVIIKGAKSEINHFEKEWINKWFGIVELEKDWFRNYWNEKEFSIIKEINTEIIKNYKKWRLSKIKPTKKLIELSKEFEKIRLISNHL